MDEDLSSFFEDFLDGLQHHGAGALGRCNAAAFRLSCGVPPVQCCRMRE